ncbi:MAG: type II toxin-antitoxin system RelE/ParE family toxin [Clostridiales Family XIII bacterium]|jgi:plasmid stabilization system protein ParE|nr:type II toxin-antitoxin system RelE/ParE family toxin [Clostridiales Family XIII bacterium]
MPKNKKRLQYSDEAIADIERLSIFLIERAGAQTSFDTIGELTEGIDKLKDMPYLGSLHPNPLLAAEGLMVYFLGHYVCVYFMIDDTVYIAGVFHQRADWISQFAPVQENTD